jgi:hypothetical protein
MLVVTARECVSRAYRRGIVWLDGTRDRCVQRIAAIVWIVRVLVGFACEECRPEVGELDGESVSTRREVGGTGSRRLVYLLSCYPLDPRGYRVAGQHVRECGELVC